MITPKELERLSDHELWEMENAARDERIRRDDALCARRCVDCGDPVGHTRRQYRLECARCSCDLL